MVYDPYFQKISSGCISIDGQTYRHTDVPSRISYYCNSYCGLQEFVFIQENPQQYPSSNLKRLIANMLQTSFNACFLRMQIFLPFCTVLMLFRDCAILWQINKQITDITVCLTITNESSVMRN